MSQRDQKTVLTLVLGLVGVGVLAVFLQSWLLGPLAEYDRQISSLEDDVETKDRQILDIKLGKKLVDAARLRSLPASRVKASSEYDRYLVTLLQSSGLTEVGVTGPPAEGKAKAVAAATATANAPKKAAHTVLTYQIRAKGGMANIISALENIQRTPVVHRIKGLTIGRQDSSGKESNNGKLIVQLTLEAMIVAGTKLEHEPSLKADASYQQAGGLAAVSGNSRHYDDIALKNIFTGPVPALAGPPAAPDLTMLTSEEEAIPEHVRLVSTEPTSQEAFLRTLIFQMPETRIRSKAGSGYDTFRIMNEERTKVLVKARVLRIDQRDVYFQVRDDVFNIHIGQTIADAMRRPLSDAELDRLQLRDLVQQYDPKDDPAKTNASKKTGNNSKKR